MYAQISRYASDHGVAFLDLLNTEADEGQLQHTKLCLLLQNKSHGTEMVQGTCSTI